MWGYADPGTYDWIYNYGLPIAVPTIAYIRWLFSR